MAVSVLSAGVRLLLLCTLALNHVAASSECVMTFLFPVFHLFSLAFSLLFMNTFYRLTNQHYSFYHTYTFNTTDTNFHNSYRSFVQLCGSNDFVVFGRLHGFVSDYYGEKKKTRTANSK